MPTTTINFNTGTVGAAITGFTQSSGDPFTYRAGTGSAPFATQGAGSASPANDQWALYTADGSITGSQTAQVAQYMQVSGASWQGLGIVLCANIGFTNGYLISWDLSNGTAVVYKKVSGTYNLLGTSSAIGPTRTPGNPATVKADFDSATNTISVKVWDSLGSEPGSYGYSVVDSSSPYTGGYAGFRLGKDGSSLGGTLHDDFILITPATGPTTCTITGPSAGRPSVASTNFTATLDAAATASTVVTPSDGGAGGTFTPSTVTIGIGSTTGTFTYTASSTGAKTITATNDQSLTNVGSLTYTAYSLAVSPGSQSAANSTAASITATLTGGSGSLSASTTVGTLSTTTPTSGTPFTLTTPSSGSGTVTVTVTGPGGTSQTATISYGAASALTLTAGSATGTAGVASANFTIATNGTLASDTNVTVSVSPTATITSTPVVLTAGSSPTGTFTITPPSAGSYTVSVSAGGLSSPSSVTYTAYALSVSPSSASVNDGATQNITATLTGGSGSLTASLTGSGSLSTTSPTSGTPFVYTAPSSGSGTATVTVTGPGGTSATCTLTYAPAAATALTWVSYPSTVPVGTASSNFTIATNGNAGSVAVTVTPSSGTITTSPVVLSSGVNSSGTFTFTAPSAGSYTISLTNGSGLTNPSPVTVTAAAVSTLNFDFVAGVTGLSTVGYTLYDNAAGTVYQSRTTSGVAELGSTGIYRVAVSLPKTLDVLCVWDLASGGVAKFAQEYTPRS